MTFGGLKNQGAGTSNWAKRTYFEREIDKNMASYSKNFPQLSQVRLKMVKYHMYEKKTGRIIIIT